MWLDKNHGSSYIAEQTDSGNHIGCDTYADQETHERVDYKIDALLKAVAESLEHGSFL